MTDTVRINNTIISNTSCLFRAAGVPYEGILALDFEQTRERKKVWGSRRNGKALGRTSGKYEAKDATLTMLADSYDVLTDALTLLGGGSYGDAEFPFIAQYLEPSPGIAGSILPITIALQDCAIVGEKEGYAEGIDEKVVEVTLSVMAITKNGKILYSALRSIP